MQNDFITSMEDPGKILRILLQKCLFLGSVNYQDAAEEVAEESPKPKVKTIFYSYGMPLMK